jgi:serine protease
VFSRVRFTVAAAAIVSLGAAGGALAASPAGAASWRTSGDQILWTTSGAPAAAEAAAPSASALPDQNSYNNLIFHGGVVMHHPHIYTVFYGSEWGGKGFTAGPRLSSATIRHYENSFFANVGGTAWHGVQAQYCDGVATGSVSCPRGTAKSHMVRNERNLLAGTWVDPTPAPAFITATVGEAENATTDPIAAEAVKAERHFKDASPDALYMVFTPPGHQATAYGSVYCAYHSEVVPTNGGHGIRFAFMPFTPEQGAGCGGNSVNKKNNSFGNGYLDTYTLAGGHEFEEAVTDPDGFPFQDGWNDYQTSENGDKCAYFHAANLKLAGHLYAVQPMWSNEANHGAGGCAMTRGTGTFPVPSPLPVS